MASTEELLARTQKQLEELQAEYLEFAYIVSHDLSAPFRQIDGFAKIIIKNNADGFDEKTQKYMNLIINGSAKGKEILDLLLEYSRLDTRGEAVTSVDCNKLFGDTLNQLAEMIEHTRAEIDYVTLPVIKAYQKQVGLLFYHILHNALLYQEEGNQPLVSVTAEDTETCWKFCVKDNGIGVRSNSIEKIFKVLRRDVTDDHYPGVGMGLALAKKIIKRHGGDIWVDSVKGDGAAFYFTIAHNPEM